MANSGRGMLRIDLARQLEIHPCESHPGEMQTTGTDIGAGESLLDAGVDSISATEVRDKLKERLAVYLPETLVFDYPTPHDIAQFVMESA